MDDRRAYEALTNEHLDRLSEIARRDREGLFNRYPRLGALRDLIISVALCQGGALHYVDGHTGIKDLDVWTLYAEHPDIRYPHRRHGEAQFGPSELTGWSGRVDLFGRSLPYSIGQNAIAVWRGYLGTPRTKSAWLLAQKAVVIIEPAELRGEVAWRGGMVM